MATNEDLSGLVRQNFKLGICLEKSFEPVVQKTMEKVSKVL
jgi:hypothetical protein